jgi:hypothetical protein
MPFTGEPQMDSESLSAEAGNLLAQMRQTPPREAGEPLRWQDKARILELRDEGFSQEHITAEVGCHQSTVSRTLTGLDDSRPFAQLVLRSQRVALLEQIVERMKTANMADLIKLAGKLDIVREDRADTRGNDGTLIAIGVKVETMSQPTGYVRPDGTPITAADMAPAKATVLIGAAPPGTPLNPIPVTSVERA